MRNELSEVESLACELKKLQAQRQVEWDQYTAHLRFWMDKCIEMQKRLNPFRAIASCSACEGFGQMRGHRCDECFGSGLAFPSIEERDDRDKQELRDAFYSMHKKAALLKQLANQMHDAIKSGDWLSAQTMSCDYENMVKRENL